MLGVPVVSVPCQGVDEFILSTRAGILSDKIRIHQEVIQLLEDDTRYEELKLNCKDIHAIISLPNIKRRYERVICNE